MQTPDLSLTHLVRRPARESARPPLLILLHGVGSNERDLFELAPLLDERLLILSARGPLERGPGGYAWFEVTFTPGGPTINPAQAEASRQALIRFIDEAVAAYGADPARVYLMGFSQGAIMSASVALTAPELVAGAVLMSGRILPEIRPELAEPARLARPCWIGSTASAVPCTSRMGSPASRALLESLPVDLDYREYPQGHEVSQRSLADIAAWLRQRLDGPVR